MRKGLSQFLLLRNISRSGAGTGFLAGSDTVALNQIAAQGIIDI